MTDTPDLHAAAQALLDAMDADPMLKPGQHGEALGDDLEGWLVRREAAVHTLRAALANEAIEPQCECGHQPVDHVNVSGLGGGCYRRVETELWCSCNQFVLTDPSPNPQRTDEGGEP